MKVNLRRTLLAIVLALVLLLSPSSCQKQISVKSGELLECRYGHVIKDDVKTLKVPQADINKYSVKRKVSVCADHLKAEKLYNQARKAITDGDKAKAIAILKKIIKIDPEFRDTARLIAELTPKGSKDKIKVRTGTRTVCTHGELISEDIKEIEVLASQANKYSVKEIRTTCAPHKQADELYQKAQRALSDNKKASAEAYLRQTLEKDPGSEEARRLLASLVNTDSGNGGIVRQTVETIENTVGAVISGSPSGSGSTTDNGSNSNTDNDDSRSSPTLNLFDRIPKTIDEYEKIATTQEELMATAMFTKAKKSFISFQVMQHAGNEDAKRQVRNSSNVYSDYQQSEKVKNNDAIFGTDGRELSYLGWTEGAVSYELEMMEEGQNPEQLIDEMLVFAKLTK